MNPGFAKNSIRRVDAAIILTPVLEAVAPGRITLVCTTRGKDVARVAKRPQIETLTLTSAKVGDAHQLEPYATVELVRLTDVDLSGRDLSGLELSGCRLTSVSLDDTDLTGARLVETRLEGINAPRMSMPRSFIRQVEICASRVGALDLFESRIRSLVVDSAKIELANFRGSDVRDVLFRGCIIGELDLVDATVARMAFEDCTVTTLDVHQATLSDVDLRGLDIGTIHHLDGLRGCTIDGEQALGLTGHFAAHLGIFID
ncbi:pentapeptide repeat-containing protein [Gordonia polyisoprenivorans]|uniref:pentapeptide repeat-containing protein n=1 Tax=Gordonia polyisoprenivorans TaxID=84595 RepID=UPI002010E5C7|nr:pentapeptide repeat-containing protein [Gordonia polyisoprenivorans]